MVSTHYDVLGVEWTATPQQIRQAYKDRARVLHPDRAGRDGARAMQDLNEAWRVLRDPATRAAYDRSLRREPTAAGRRDVQPDIDLDDRPVPRPMAQPGDVGVAVVRSLPWIAVLAVLGAIFVFTAFARTGEGASSDDLIDRCIATEAGRPVEVPCDEPNEGRVTLIVDRQTRCPSGTTARAVAGGDWYCLRPADAP